jgi:hypothetical protein
MLPTPRPTAAMSSRALPAARPQPLPPARPPAQPGGANHMWPLSTRAHSRGTRAEHGLAGLMCRLCCRSLGVGLPGVRRSKPADRCPVCTQRSAPGAAAGQPGGAAPLPVKCKNAASVRLDAMKHAIVQHVMTFNPLEQEVKDEIADVLATAARAPQHVAWKASLKSRDTGTDISLHRSMVLLRVAKANTSVGVSPGTFLLLLQSGQGLAQGSGYSCCSAAK